MAFIPSTIQQFLNYTNSGPGLENFLRLVQSICQVIAACSISGSHFEKWTIAWKNLALSRRYFRYFQFINCFDRALSLMTGQNGSFRGNYLLLSIDVGKWSCLGGYLLLEAFTIFDALGVWVTQWSHDILMEGYKFWFYSMSFSIIGITLRLLGSSETAATPKKPEHKPNGEKAKVNGKEEKEQEGSASSTADREAAIDKSTTNPWPALVEELVILGCDILIPGMTLGWIDVSPLTVASATVVSTLLVGKGRWAKAQKVQ